MRGVKPVLFGYQCVRLGTPPDQVVRGRRLLAEYAAREGFALAEVYVDDDVNRPDSALVALIAAATRGGVAAVAVPTLEDLGRLPRVRRLWRERLQREAGVRVLVVEPVTTADQVVELVVDSAETVEVVGRRSW
jgi:hypothetical protein